MGFNLDDYEPVASRLDRFLKAHPDAKVITDLVHYLSDVAVFKCELWLNGEIIATGWAAQREVYLLRLWKISVADERTKLPSL